MNGLLLAGLLAAAPVALAPAAQAQTRQASCNTAFFLANSTGKPIHYLHVRPIGSPNWSGDLLGSDVLMPGRNANVRLAYGGMHEMKAVAGDGTTYSGRFNPCEAVIVTIR